jgi:hypothetical protein
MANVGDIFKPGDKVPNSGIYDVIHDATHPRHQVTCVYEEPFPPCKRCGHGVRFKLAIKALHLKDHENFK